MSVLKFLFVASLLTLFSCSEVSFSNKISSGQIEYEISYPNIPEGSYLLDLMPKKMETKFNDGNFRSDIVAGMGLFRTSIIYENGKENLTHSVKMLNKKYASHIDLEEMKKFNPGFEDISFELIEEEKEIAGYKCSAAKAMVGGDSSWTFTIYYTKKIDIKNSNQHTPFKKIDGVLMQYDILSYDTHMRFTATSVSPTEIIKEEILLEDDYKMIPPEELKKEIEAIFAKVK